MKTLGIVLGYIRYGETSIVSTIYTEALGRQSYMVKGVRSSKRKDLLPLLIPLSIVEFETTNRPNAKLQYLKELQIHYPFVALPFDNVRRAVAMFVAVLLMKSVRQDNPDSQLFAFLSDSIKTLDTIADGLVNFHIHFMLRLASVLGFEPNTRERQLPYFDLMNGTMTATCPAHDHYVCQSDLSLWLQAADLTTDTLSQSHFTRDDRQRLISIFEQYYMLHITGFTPLNSHLVLHEVI
ncbi:MAG: DNA repair protein RecO [Bacteroidales bacterium]|nr:DNA repair protein RecO [Bacteroidales bacterium]